MKHLKLTLAVLALSCAALPLAKSATEVAQASDATPILLGTYDSRLVALAFYHSEEAERERATLAASQGAAAMQALQEQMHQQVFGNAPIPAIVAKLDGHWEQVALEAGVDAIVGKWDLRYRQADIKVVDLSFQVAEAFGPAQGTLKQMRELASQDPVELQDHSH